MERERRCIEIIIADKTVCSSDALIMLSEYDPDTIYEELGKHDEKQSYGTLFNLVLYAYIENPVVAIKFLEYMLNNSKEYTDNILEDTIWFIYENRDKLLIYPVFFGHLITKLSIFIKEVVADTDYIAWLKQFINSILSDIDSGRISKRITIKLPKKKITKMLKITDIHDLGKILYLLTEYLSNRINLDELKKTLKVIGVKGVELLYDTPSTIGGRILEYFERIAENRAKLYRVLRSRFYEKFAKTGGVMTKEYKEILEKILDPSWVAEIVSSDDFEERLKEILDRLDKQDEEDELRELLGLMYVSDDAWEQLKHMIATDPYKFHYLVRNTYQLRELAEKSKNPEVRRLASRLIKAILTDPYIREFFKNYKKYKKYHGLI